MISTMLHTLALFCLVAAPAFGATFPKGFRVKFECDATQYGKKAFLELPQTTLDAVAKGWRQPERDTAFPGYEKIIRWCPKDDYNVCLYFDDTDMVAGVQINIDVSTYSNDKVDWTVSGFKPWSVTENGKTTNFYATNAFFLSKEDLESDSALRLSNRNTSIILQDRLYFKGINGELYNVSSSTNNIDTNVFTKQACVPKLGNHLYYNMGSDSTCAADKLFPWSLLEKDGQLIGFVFMFPGKITDDNEYFIAPTKAAIKAVLPDVPTCMAELADDPGLLLLHFYFIDDPRNITCSATSKA